MEIQIPLVLFTSFLAWSVGIFGTQCVLALKKLGGKIQLASLIASVIALVVGGICVVFHLTHPFHIFNGFGHLTSGITQELIAIVIFAVVIVLYFLMLRRSDDDSVPKWLAIVGLVVCALMIIAMGHSYMMASKPTWNSIFQLLSLLGAACVLGPATVAIIAQVRKVELPQINLYVLVGVIVNIVLTAAFMIAMQAGAGSLESFAYYFDPPHPNHPLMSPADVSLFASDCVAAAVLVIVGLIVSLIGALMAKRDKGPAMAWYGLTVVGGLVCVIALRVSMYIMGATLFMIY